jgi:hypothetical protein
MFLAFSRRLCVCFSSSSSSSSSYEPPLYCCVASISSPPPAIPCCLFPVEHRLPVRQRWTKRARVGGGVLAFRSCLVRGTDSDRSVPDPAGRAAAGGERQRDDPRNHSQSTCGALSLLCASPAANAGRCEGEWTLSSEFTHAYSEECRLLPITGQCGQARP